MKKRILSAILCAAMLISLCAAAEGTNFFLEAIGVDEEPEQLPVFDLTASEWTAMQPELNDDSEWTGVQPELNGAAEEWTGVQPELNNASEWTAMQPELNGAAEEWTGVPELNAVSPEWAAEQPELYAAPEKSANLEISYTKATIYAGDKGLRIMARFSDGKTVNSDGTTREIRYYTSNSKYATVDANGVVTGKKTGSAVITVGSMIEGEIKTVDCAVKIAKKPKQVSLTPATLNLMVGATGQLTPVFQSGYGASCTFGSNDESIATVDGFGIVTAKKKGTCGIRVATYNGVYGYATVNVCSPATSIEFVEKEITLYKGAEKQLNIRMNDFETDTFTCSIEQKGSIISVNENGIVSGLNAGTATITLRTQTYGRTASCKVTVLPAPEKLNVPTSLTIGKGDQLNLVSTGIVSAGDGGAWSDFLFSSSRTKYATINASGLLVGKAVGYTDILVRTLTGLSATIRVNVLKKAEKITVSPSTLYLAAGMSGKLTVSFPSKTYSAYTLETDNPNVLQVDMLGNVTALKSVNKTTVAHVRAITASGMYSYCTVNIYPAPTNISLGNVPQKIGMGDSFRLTPVLRPSDAYNRVSCENSNPNAVILTDEGDVLGIGTGKSRITVETCNGLTASFELQVVPYNDLHPYIRIAHRGASGYYPENSLEAFRHAKELGADMVELDVRKSKDGVLVVQHNAAVTKSGKSTQVSSLTYSELLKLNSNLCTLEEALNCLKAYDIDVQIEMKVTGIESSVVKTVSNCGIRSRVWYGSFNMASLNTIRALDSSARTIYIISDATEYGKVCSNPTGYKFDVASISTDIINQEGANRLHIGGKQVYAWTIADEASYNRAINSGVDGIISNYPDLI